MMRFEVATTSMLILSMIGMSTAALTTMKVQSLKRPMPHSENASEFNTDVAESKFVVSEAENVTLLAKEILHETTEAKPATHYEVSFMDEILEETCSVSCEVLLLAIAVLFCSRASLKSKGSSSKSTEHNPKVPSAESGSVAKDMKDMKGQLMKELSLRIQSMRQRDAADTEIACEVLNVFKQGTISMNRSSTTACIFILSEMQEPTLMALVFRAFCELQVLPSQKAIATALRAIPEGFELSFLQTLSSQLAPEAKDEQFYFLVVQCCANMEDRTLAEHFVQEANSLKLCSARVLHQVLAIFVKDKRHREAICLLQSISASKQLPLQVKFNMELNLLCKQGSVEEARQLIASATEPVDETARNHFLRLVASKDLQNEAESEVAAIRSSGKEVNVAGYIALVEMYFRLSSVTQALKTFDAAKSEGKVNHMLYAQMLRNLTYLGHFAEAMTVFDEMNAAGFADLSLSALLASKLMANCFQNPAQRFENARCVLQDARPRQVNCANGCTVENFMTLIRCAGELGLLDVALATFDLSVKCHGKADSLMYNKMMDVCIACKQPRRAVKFFEAISAETDTVPDVISFNTVIRAYAQIGELQKAFDLIQEMTRQSIKPNAVTFNSLAGAAIKAGEVERAWRILPLMAAAGVQPDEVTYSTLIMGIKQSKSVQLLNRGFECLQHLKDNNLKPDEVLFNSLMDACVHLQQMPKACAVFKSMKDAGVKPSFVAYSILVKGYGMQRNLNAALQVKEDMDAAGVVPNAVLYGSLADVALKSGDYERAEQILQEMDDKGIDGTVVTHSLKIKICGRRRQLQKALDLFDEMESQALQPSAFTFNSLLDTVARCRQMQHVPLLLQRMKKYGLKPDLITFSTIIKGYCQADDLPQAMETFKILKDQGHKPDEILYNSLLDGCARSGDTAQARALLIEMKDAGIAESEVTFSILVKAHANANEIDEVFGILEQMREARFKPGMVIYTSIIQTCASAGQFTRALEVFEEMCKKGIQADGATFAVLIAGYARNSEWRRAVDLVKRAMNCNVRLHSKTYRFLSVGLVRAQQHLLSREFDELQKQWAPDDRTRANMRQQ